MEDKMTPFQVWIPDSLHRKVKEKAARDKLTIKALITRFLIVYSGWKEGDNGETKPQGT
jgi:hypothetical protein